MTAEGSAHRVAVTAWFQLAAQGRGFDDHDVAAVEMELRASYLGKPLQIDELVSAIHRELDKEH